MGRFGRTPITIDKIEQFLIPSALLEDEDIAHVVRPLVTLSILSIIIVVVYALLWVFILPKHADQIFLALLMLIPAGLPLFLIRLKRVRLARDVMLVGAWIIVTITILTSGGTRAPIFELYTLLVMIAALLSGWRLAFSYAIATIVLGFVIAMLDPAGTVLVPFATPLSAWLTHVITMIIVTGAAYSVLRQTQQALQRAKDALAERKRIQQELIESEERFRLISSVASDYTFSSRMTAQGELEHNLLSGAFESITGYTPEEFLAIGGWLAILHPDDLAQDARDIATLRENRRVVSELRIIKKGGEVRWVRVYAHPVWDTEQKQLIQINGAVQDITERKRLETELQSYANKLEKLVDERTNALLRAKEQLELVLNNTTNALAFADTRGDVLVTNPAFRATFAEGGARSIEFILWSLANDEQIAQVSDALLKAIYDGETQRVEAQIGSGNGKQKDVELVLIPVSITDNDSGGGILLSGHDITPLKEIERFKARFIADAVHDLATPISGLSTRLYLLQHNPEKMADHVSALENQVLHLRNLLEDLRTLSRMGRGQMILKMEMCNVNELAQRVFDTYEPVAINKQQALKLCLAANLPEVRLDQRQIERMLVNLVSNAINYSPQHKEINIETALEGQAVVIKIVDQGIGINDEDLPYIFERFYRAADARKHLNSGTGLGLAITKEIVEVHGGSVTATSKLGQGSTFTVMLPLQS